MAETATEQTFRGHGKWLRRSRMASPHNRKQNYLLAALPADEQIRLFPQLELIEMPLGLVLFGTGSRPEYAYFPTNCTVSLCHDNDTTATEVAIVGHEGMIGIDLLIDEDVIPHRAVVQNAGYAYRIGDEALRQEFNRGGSTQSLLVRYIQALSTQMAQTSGCNRHHTVDQQLCRWLLQRLDHLPSNDLTVPHEMVASTLGVGRESVMKATAKLQADGLIHSSRNRIQLLNRSGIEARACECYHVMKNEIDKLFPARKAYQG